MALFFLWIGIQSIFSGQVVLIDTHGDPEHIAGSIAMPVMIAPGTISASVLIGSSLPASRAAMAIVVAIAFSGSFEFQVGKQFAFTLEKSSFPVSK